MNKVTTIHCYRRTSNDWRADKIKFVVPKILKQYKRCGVRFYKCEGNRTFIADIFDSFFKVIPGKRKPNNYKGELIGGFYE